ncbi:MAG: helix-turn-helix domain-containing protein [Ignavibacteria bacterium]|nr:helix-turn-helix domain-containing protein [Ignavibacteria bacterium]
MFGDKDEYLTLNEVMALYNKTYTQIRYAAETKRLTAIKVGWQWLFPKDKLPKDWPDAPRIAKNKGVNNT